jgi:hypothetical protein
MPDPTKKQGKNKLVVLPILVENSLFFLSGTEKFF